MTWFNDLKIGTRLALVFGIMFVFMISIGIIGYWGMSMIETEVIKDLDTDGVIAQHAGRARANIQGLRRYEKDIFINIGSNEKVENYYKEWNEERQSLIERISTMGKAAVDQKDKDFIKHLKEDEELYTTGFNKIYEMIRNGKIKTTMDANLAMNEYKDKIHKMETDVKDFSVEGYKRLDHIREQAQIEIKESLFVMVPVIAVIILIGVMAAIYITLGIRRPIKEAVEIANSLANGDLTIVVRSTNKDETGQMMSSIKNMVEKLRQVVGDVMAASDNVASGSSELS